jgi:hypothetical protein
MLSWREKMNAITNISEAFEVLIPEIKNQHIKFITAALVRLEEKYGNLGIARRDLSNSWSPDGACYRKFRSFLKYIEGNKPSRNLYEPMEIDHAYIEKVSQQNAEAEVASFVAKLERKFEDLDTAELNYARGPNFELLGSVGDVNVRIEQQMILKISKNGVLFNQFPARIYVNGKFLSEKNFKETYKKGGF